MDGTSGRILIVDDDPPVLEALSAALHPPYEVLTTGTGLGALEAAGSHPPDLILLDYVLPDLSGLALVRAIKRCFPSIFVVLMTAYGSEDVSVEAFRSGARDYLRKPIHLRDLLARVETLLASRRASASRRSTVFLEMDPARGGGSRIGSLQRCLDFVEQHLHTDVSLEQVAREAGMSKFHFCRHFKSTTGLTFREFLARRRVARATDLLREPGRSVTEVSLDVGFKDTSHFSRVFRRLMGQRPSRYRQVAGEQSRSTEGSPASRTEPGQG